MTVVDYGLSHLLEWNKLLGIMVVAVAEVEAVIAIGASDVVGL